MSCAIHLAKNKRELKDLIGRGPFSKRDKIITLKLNLILHK